MWFLRFLATWLMVWGFLQAGGAIETEQSFGVVFLWMLLGLVGLFARDVVNEFADV